MFLRYLIFMMLLISCSSKPHQDPLKNSKQLIKKGHSDLYNNGAFKVPKTNILLIPKGPEMWDLAAQWAGPKAKESFLLSLNNAADSVVVISEGIKTSFRLGKKIDSKTIQFSKELRKYLNPQTTLVMEKSRALGMGIIGSSWTVAQKSHQSLVKSTRENEKKNIKNIKNQSKEIDNFGKEVVEFSLEKAAELSHYSLNSSFKGFRNSYHDFTEGMIKFPSKVSKNFSKIEIKKSLKKFNENYKDFNLIRKEYSSYSENGLTKSMTQAKLETADSFSKAKENMKDVGKTGLTFGALKALGNILEGIFWHASIKPIGSGLYYGAGYVFTNAIAYPVITVMQTGIQVTSIAVKVAWRSAESAIDFVAPTGELAYAGIFNFLKLSGGELASGSLAFGGTVTGLSVRGSNKIVEQLSKGGAILSSKGLQYIGAPLAYAGVGTIGTVTGVTTVVGGATLGVAGRAATEIGSLGAYSGGKIVSGGVIVGGSILSLGSGVGLGVYEIGKSVVVPSSYVLGSGMVLTYGNLVHLGAHSLLAVADASYLVLSMEGPKAVIYAVKGVVGKNDDIPEGTVLNLEKLREQGEVIYQVPATEEEVKKVMESLAH